MRAIAVVSASIVLMTACPVMAVTIRVPEDYPTVSAGIGAAVAGDTVLIAIGTFVENPTANVNVLPGVVVIGSGWESPGNSTLLNGIRLTFSAGVAPAIVQDLWIFNRRVRFENPNAVLRHCRIGNGFIWPDSHGFIFSDGGTMESCFVQSDFASGAHTCIMVEGGDVNIQGNVIDSKNTDWMILMLPQNTVNSLEVRDNTFHEEFGGLNLEVWPTPSGTVSWVNNIFASGSIGLTCAAGTIIQYNLFDGFVDEERCHPLDETNLLTDSGMCDAHWLGDFEDFALNANSPCIGAGEDGSTIGALGVGCGITAVPNEESPAAHMMRMEVVPNPVSSSGTLRVSKPLEGSGVVRCWNAAGRLIASRSFSSLTSQEIDLQQVLSEVPAERQSGVLFFELRAADGQSAVAKALIVR